MCYWPGPFSCQSLTISPCQNRQPACSFDGGCGDRRCRRRALARRAVGRLLTLLLLLRQRAGGTARWRRHVVLAIALHGDLHALAIEGDILVADVGRPWIDHLRDPVGRDVVIGTERQRLTAVVVDVGATAEQ